MTINKKLNRIAMTILVFVSVPQIVFASTVLQVDVDYLLNNAKLIFEGEVVSSKAKWNYDKTSITTFTTFRVDEVIKGEIQDSTLTLEFSGGTVGETGLHVSAMVYPPVGETGIYFIENPGMQLANPLVGWGQGHFRIEKDSNAMGRVFTEDGSPVLSLDFTSMNGAVEINAGPTSALPFSHGVARGVWTGTRDVPMSTVMEKRQFKDALKARLANIRSKAESTSGSADDDHGR
ncbi:MAG: hypothetical protein WBN90_14695 [Gammaproteobacteria bacterium]